ncbi:DNA polymerase Y family protein [Silvimonas sp. JCM 19000]
MLWLAIAIPTLPLLVCPRRVAEADSGPARPRLVVESHGKGQRAMLVDALAASLGLKAGMKLSAALALVNELDVQARQPAAEAQRLTLLASWALQFTPTVVIDGEHGLLLEIGGCLRYFGGLTTLQHKVAEGLAAQGIPAYIACAPTPLAASWRAACGLKKPVADPSQLAFALAGLPLDILPVPAATLDGLAQLGLKNLGQVYGLPRKGLAKRFGPQLPQLLDRAMGILADPRESFVAPDRFEHSIDLDYPVETVPVFIHVAKWLFDELELFLSGRGLGVQQVTFRLRHEDIPPTELQVRFGRPGRRAAEFMLVLQEKVERYELAAAAPGITLIAEQLHALHGMPLGLFGHEAGDANFQLLLARLRARMGDDAVQGVRCVADHRPERAWSRCEPGAGSKPGAPPDRPTGPRPGWLLPQPHALSWRNEQLWHGEALQCEARPERIETGWWDGESVARDYYVARGVSGRHYWVFQDRASQTWWLHGLFA